MINLLLKLIFFLFNLIFSVILNIVMMAFPVLNLSGLTNIFNSFFGLLTHAFNLTVFLLGDSAYFFADIVIVILTAKHIVLPAVNIIRKFFIH